MEIQNTVLNNTWVTERMKKETGKFLESSIHANITYQNSPKREVYICECLHEKSRVSQNN